MGGRLTLMKCRGGAGGGQKLHCFSNNQSLNKIFQELSRDEFCVANFKPPANGASRGSFFCVENLTSASKHVLN